MFPVHMVLCCKWGWDVRQTGSLCFAGAFLSLIRGGLPKSEMSKSKTRFPIRCKLACILRWSYADLCKLGNLLRGVPEQIIFPCLAIGAGKWRKDYNKDEIVVMNLMNLMILNNSFENSRSPGSRGVSLLRAGGTASGEGHAFFRLSFGEVCAHFVNPNQTMQ